ncbi:dihydrofolate reductase, partial [Jeotgalibaca arthritidis]|uniref:dihydrofolate reductase n=1 Tax=Jeotgalibaca arthritidis TaxID=1868794 RepID=UPI0035A0790E
MIIFVWAEDEKGAIGKDGGLPWKLPNDMKFFKETTTGHTVLMGRKTFESMGNRPLPNRQNLIMTRQLDYQADGVTVVHHLDDIIGNSEDIYVIGGSEIFKQFMPVVDVLWQTKIAGDFDGDTFFPQVNWDDWQLVEKIPGIRDEKNK